MTIAVDFDGTIVEHRYPKIGKEKPFAIETLRRLASEGHKLILWTSREGDLLQEAVDFCKGRDLMFYSVNSTVPDNLMFRDSQGKCPKLLADVYIDDRNLGGLPEWGVIYEQITGMRYARKRKRSLLGRLFR